MKVIIYTTPKMQKRHHYCEASLISRDVRPKHISKWSGADYRDYRYTNDVFEAARDSGFPHFQRWIDADRQKDVNIGLACQHWNWCQILLCIANQENAVLLIQDDVFLVKPYIEYRKDFAFLENSYKHFKFLMLSHWVPNPDDFRSPSSKRQGVNPETETDIYYIAREILGGGDHAFVISSRGAEFLLDEKINCYKTDIFYKVDGRLEFITGLLSQDPIKKKTYGCYSVRKNCIREHGIGRFDRKQLPSHVHKGNSWDTWIRPIEETSQ